MTERLTVEHYVGKCFVKCAQIILGSRVYQDEDRKPSPDKRSAQWFLLEVDELAGLSARLDPWRRDVYAPLVIEVFIQPWDTNMVMPAAFTSCPPQGHPPLTTASAAGGKTLLERWTLGYTAGTSAAAAAAGTNSRPVMEPAAVYKRLILLIRSLYSYVRVLPAYRMYRACKRHSKELFNTSYSISTTPLPLPHQQYGSTAAAAAHAGSGNSSSRMQQFCFSPIETMFGVFEMSVEYQPANTVHFLEQTSLLPCQPRIITDYVDGPYARSAPSDRVMRPHPDNSSSSSSRGNAARDASGDNDGSLGFLRSSQHHTPLVRHSWSSKDIPVVQRGFNPPARSNSLNSTAAVAAAAAAAGSSANQQQQQQVLLHRRSLSQGYGGPVGGDSGSGTSLAAGGAVTSNVTNAGIYAGSHSPAVFGGPSSLGRPPLPHSPANAHHSSSSSNAGAYSSAAAAAAAAPLPPASPGTPSSSSSRTGGVGSTLLRSLSANAAAAASAAAAAAAAAAAGIASSAPGQAGSGLSTLAVQQLSRLGSSFSGSNSPLGSAPRVLGFGGPRQQQQQQHKSLMDPQARQQGFHVKDSSSSSSRGQMQAAACHEPVMVTAAAGGGTQQQQQQRNAMQSEAFCLDAFDASLASAATPAAAAAAEGADGGSLNCRVASAPVSIPGRGKGRAKSVTDLTNMAAAAAAEGDTEVQQQQQRQQPTAVRSKTQGGLSAAVALGLRQQVQQDRGDNSSGSSILSVATAQQHKQQLVQAASSAPAAPRGMLGQLLSASSTTSPSVSPPYSAAAATRPAAAAAAAAVEPHSGAATDQIDGCTSPIDQLQSQQTSSSSSSAAAASSSSSSAAAAAAANISAGRSHAIIIRPQPSQVAHHAAAAAAAGASPSPGSRLLQLNHSRTPSTGYTVSGFSLGAQPATPGGLNPTGILSCSPQLPFAFTPSGASLGMSIISLTDQHKTLLAGSSGTPAAAAAAARGGTGGGGVPGGFGARLRNATGGPAAAAGSTPPAAGSSEASSSSGACINAIGTPSPPPHVSCVRDITGLATIRRPSWSSRSSSFDVATSASLPRHLSMSPMGDLLDPALLGCSGSNSSGHNTMGSLAGMGRGAAGGAAAARAAAAAAVGVVGDGSGVMTPAVVLPGGFGSSDQHESAAAAAAAGGGETQRLLDPEGEAAADSQEPDTSHSAAAAAGELAAAAAAAAGGGISTGDDLLNGSTVRDESESDILPFAIDTETYLTAGAHAAGAAAGGVGHMMMQSHAYQQQQQYYSGPRFEMQGYATPTAAAPTAAERDVAVGAFVKLIQEASSRQLHRCHHHQQQQQQQQQQGCVGSGEIQARDQPQQGLGVEAVQQQQQQQQQLSVADALEQVQQMAAHLEMLVFPERD